MYRLRTRRVRRPRRRPGQPGPASQSPERPPASRPPAAARPPERVPNGRSAAPAYPAGPQPGRLPIGQPIPAGYPPGHPAGDGRVPPAHRPAPLPRQRPADQPVAPGSPPAPRPPGPESRNGATNTPPGHAPGTADPWPGSGPRPDPAGRPGNRHDPGAGQAPGPIARPRSWFEPNPRQQDALPRPPEPRAGPAPQPPVAVPAGSGAAAPRPAPVQEPPEPGSVSGTESREQRPPGGPPPSWTGQDALDDTCPLPVILPGRGDVPAADLAPGPERRPGSWRPPPAPPSAAPADRRPARDGAAIARLGGAKLDQIKDRYLTGQAAGEDTPVRHLDEVSQRQRDLIRGYFEQPGRRPSAALRPDDNTPADGQASTAPPSWFGQPGTA